MNALSKNRSLLLVGVFLFFTAIIFLSSVNAKEDVPFKDPPRNVYILAQAPKPTGQQQASQPQGTGTSKPGTPSQKSSAKAKSTATDDDDDDDDDDDEDTQPVKAAPTAQPKPSFAGSTISIPGPGCSETINTTNGSSACRSTSAF